jgi:hypothetical protein
MVNTDDDANIRDYLLGAADDATRTSIEERIFSDADFFEQVGVIEDELIEQYVLGELSPPDRERFIRGYLITETAKRKVRTAEELRRRARAGGAHAPISAAQPAAAQRAKDADAQTPKNWLGFLRLPQMRYGLAFATLAAVVFGAWVLAVRPWRARQALETELARLNERPRDANPTLSLTPGAARGDDGGLPVLFLAPSTETVQFQLAASSAAGRFTGYRAIVAAIDAPDASFFIRSVPFRPKPDGVTVFVTLPGRLLARGDYRIALSGVAEGQSETPLEEYFFRITTRP